MSLAVYTLKEIHHLIVDDKWRNSHTQKQVSINSDDEKEEAYYISYTVVEFKSMSI